MKPFNKSIVGSLRLPEEENKTDLTFHTVRVFSTRAFIVGVGYDLSDNTDLLLTFTSPGGMKTTKDKFSGVSAPSVSRGCLKANEYLSIHLHEEFFHPGEWEVYAMYVNGETVLIGDTVCFSGQHAMEGKYL